MRERSRYILFAGVLLFAANILVGCRRNTQVIAVVYEGQWDVGEIKNCKQFGRKSQLHANEQALLCGSLSGEILFALDGSQAEYDELKKSGPNPDKEHWKEVRAKGEDEFFNSSAHKYVVHFTGAARPVHVEGEEPLIYWSCRKDDSGIICDP